MPVHILVQCRLFITTDLSTQMIQLNSKSRPHNNAQVSTQLIHYSACTILLAPPVLSSLASLKKCFHSYHSVAVQLTFHLQPYVPPLT